MRARDSSPREIGSPRGKPLVIVPRRDSSPREIGSPRGRLPMKGDNSREVLWLLLQNARIGLSFDWGHL